MDVAHSVQVSFGLQLEQSSPNNLPLSSLPQVLVRCEVGHADWFVQYPFVLLPFPIQCCRPPT